MTEFIFKSKSGS